MSLPVSGIDKGNVGNAVFGSAATTRNMRGVADKSHLHTLHTDFARNEVRPWVCNDEPDLQHEHLL